MTASVLTLRTWGEVHDGFRAKPLRQARYDEGAVVMADCLLDLQGDEHRARRRLENRLFRREMFRTWGAIRPVPDRPAPDLCTKPLDRAKMPREEPHE